MTTQKQSFEVFAQSRTVVTGSCLTLGPLTFHASNDWSTTQKTGLQYVFDLAVPHLFRYLGEPATPGDWKLDVKTDNLGAQASCYGLQKRLVLQPNLEVWIVLHELVHVFHGERKTHWDFFAEGLAEGISSLVAQDCRVGEPSDLTQFILGKNVEQARLVQMFRPHWNRSEYPLRDIRTKTAAAVWKNAERKHPGVLKVFHERWRLAPRGEVGPDRVLEFCPTYLEALLQTIESECNITSFTHYNARVHAARNVLLPAGLKSHPLLLAYVDRDEDLLNLSGVVVQEIAIEGPEGPLSFLVEAVQPNVPLQIEVRGVKKNGSIDTGRFYQQAFSTGSTGKIALPITGLRTSVGKYPHYRIRLIAAGALSEEIRI